MALSGTLETFSLPDVLRLLSSTKKTGLLALDGDRGRGRIWVRDGVIVAADADRALNELVEGVAFELLRFADASFEFESGAETSTDGSAHEVEDVLAEAERRLAEWREIEAVVPSLDVWVRMVEQLDTERTVTPDQWRVLARVGSGADGHTLAGRLEQGEYDVCRQLRDLVQDGMVELTEAPAPAPVRTIDVAPEAHAEPAFVEPALDSAEVSSLGAGLASFVAVGTAEEPVEVDFPAEALVTVPDPIVDAAPVDTSSTFDAMVDTGASEPSWDLEAHAGDAPADGEDDDVLSQLSQLSPKAAAAVEATWTETPAPAAAEQPAPVEAAPAAADDPVDGGDAPAAGAGDEVDQNLLLRFLSSAKS